jgi:hypothetical protein
VDIEAKAFIKVTGSGTEADEFDEILGDAVGKAEVSKLLKTEGC